ncbi:MAG: hypothetical protein J6R04_02235, partial [Clostridia bacterium]|nr:hypothetical protein [Clostridia bacterium]
MKKGLSLLLSILMLLSSLVLPTAAETASDASSDTLTIIPVSDMDSADGWSGSAVLDTTNPYQGSGSLATSFTTVSEAGDIKFQYDLASSPYDTTGMAYVYFDLYLSDADVFLGHNFELELRSPNGNDSHERRIQQTLADFIIGTPKDGWNRARVAIADMKAAGLVTASSWCYLRFFNSSDTTIGTESVTSTIKMDNVFFSSASVDPSTPTASSFTVTSASLSLSNSFNLTFVASFVGASAPVMQTEFGELVPGNPTGVDGYYSFDYNAIFAHRLADIVKPTFWYLDSEGKLAHGTYDGDYSVKQYCQNMLTKIQNNDATLSKYTAEQKAVLSRLLSNVLYYGTAAQSYASYNNEDGKLATSGVTNILEEQAFVMPEDYVRMAIRGVKTGGTATWRSASLVLDSAINVRFTFTSTRISDVTVDVILDDHTAYDLTSFSKMTAADGTTVYYFDVPVRADSYDDEITVVFDNYHESRVSYSVNTYIANNYQNNGSKLSALLSAINSYGNAAKAYVAATESESEDPMATYYVFTDADKALFEGSYQAFADRIMENGYAPTSVTGAYSGEFIRDAACQLRAHIANGDYALVKRMFEYIYSYHKADGVPYFRHIIDLIQTAATYDYAAQRSGTVDESNYKQPGFPTALFNIAPGTNACAQRFCVPVDEISGISVYLKNIPSDGRLILELSSTAPTKASTTIGFASPIASVTLNCADITTKSGWTPFAFDDDVSITPNANYYFSVRLEGSTSKATAYGVLSAPGTAYNFDQNWKGQHNEAHLAYEIHFGGADILSASQTKKTQQVSWIKHTTHAAAQRFVATTDTLSAVSVLVDSPAGVNADGSARAGAMTLYVTKTDPTTSSTLDLSGVLASATVTID